MIKRILCCIRWEDVSTSKIKSRSLCKLLLLNKWCLEEQKYKEEVKCRYYKNTAICYKNILCKSVYIFFFKISKCIDIFLKYKLHLLDWSAMCKLMATLIFSFSHSFFDLLFSLDSDILLFYLEAMNFSKTNWLYCCIFLVFNKKLLKKYLQNSIQIEVDLVSVSSPSLHWKDSGKVSN